MLPQNLPQLTNKSLDSINLSGSGIAKIISHLDPNKVHAYDMHSARMLKLCGNSICKPQSIIFNACENHCVKRLNTSFTTKCLTFLRKII